MKGFKGFDKNLCCQGFQYKIGKTYEIEGSPIICKKGFHFCDELWKCMVYYPFHLSRFAEIEAIGEIRGDIFKNVTNKIRIVREISRDQVWEEALFVEKWINPIIDPLGKGVEFE